MSQNRKKHCFHWSFLISCHYTLLLCSVLDCLSLFSLFCFYFLVKHFVAYCSERCCISKGWLTYLHKAWEKTNACRVTPGGLWGTYLINHIFSCFFLFFSFCSKQVPAPSHSPRWSMASFLQIPLSNLYLSGEGLCWAHTVFFQEEAASHSQLHTFTPAQLQPLCWPLNNNNRGFQRIAQRYSHFLSWSVVFIPATILQQTWLSNALKGSELCIE